MSETPIGEVFASMQTKFPQQPPDRTVPGRIGRDHETGNYFEIRQTPSAYSVEEHMFNQDEIQRRHPQQRSEAVTEKKRCCCQCGKEMWCYISEEVQAAIAERDATIAELRAEVAEQTRLKDFYYEQRLRREEDVGKQIAALQARVAELESKCVAAGLAVGPFALAVDSPTPTTEK